MTDLATQKKWDKAAKFFDFMNSKGPERRWAPYKRELFQHMQGNILFLALGTGLDIQFFPKNLRITGIDISPLMLEAAKPRALAYEGDISCLQMDVHDMDFAENHFDQIFTSCTFCSVPNPVEGLKKLRHTLKPGGELYMFEHTGSDHFPVNFMLNMMSPLSRAFGPEMNRDTLSNVKQAGFVIQEVNNIYLDVVKTIKAVKPL